MSEMNDQKPLLKHARQLVEAALKAGADAADAIVIQGRSQSVTCRLGKVEASDRSERSGAGLRVFIGRRQAIVSSNHTDNALVVELASRAVEMAQVSPEDKYTGLADKERLAISLPDLDLYDDAAVSTSDLDARALEAEDAALAVSGVTNSSGASAAWSSSGISLVSSDGFAGSYARTSHSVSCSVVAGDGSEKQTDYDYATAAHLEDLRGAADIGREAGERSVRRLNPKLAKTGEAPVIFDPRASASLVGHFSSAISGSAIARQASFLRNDMGNQIFGKGITIVDDPLRPRGLSSRPFDGEGVGAARMALVEDGALQSWLLDSATARELGLQTNGHARRGISSPPSPGASNLHMEPGSIDPADMIKSIDHGLYVTDLIGQGVNIVTGDYSRGASGFWIENGELTWPVSGITIAANLADIFAVLVPASDLEFRFSANAPTILVERMIVAGQ
jgi:PmbA protein